MSSNYKHLVVVVSVVVTTGVWGCKSSSSANQTAGEQTAAQKVTADATGKVKVTVSGDGFVPGAIEAKRGQPLVIEFTRVSDQTCAKQVVFPELNISKDLPLNSVVAVQVPTDIGRTLTFQCGMGMFKSSVVIL